jgi:hypothetical protein
MRLLICVCKFYVTLLFICSCIAAQDSVSVGVTPNLRRLETVERHEEPAARSFQVLELPAKKLTQYYPELKGYSPAASQDQLPQLLTKVGANEDAFLYSIPNLTAQEEITQEKLDSHGWAQGLPASGGHYSYMIKAHATGDGMRFNEGRTDANWQRVEVPATNGLSVAQNFAVFPLQFHPFHQVAAGYRYIGTQVLNGREDHVIAFAQDPEMTNLSGMVIANGTQYRVAYQGLAWIDPENFQIVRMRIDLLKPKPEVGSQMTVIQLTETHLPLVAKSMWLPAEVVIVRPIKGGSMRETHHLSDYRVFTSEKKEPVRAETSATQPK